MDKRLFLWYNNAKFNRGLLGIAFFVGTGYCFRFGAEWWVSICLIACGLGSLALAVYKFDEDTDLISGAIRRKRKARAAQIGGAKMEIKPLHMVRMFIAAHQLRKDSNKEYLMHVAVRDIVSVYKEISKNWMLVWDERHDLISIYFFQKEHRDVFPKTWAQFKKEY